VLRRHAISDADWDRVKGVLPGPPGQHGGVAEDIAQADALLAGHTPDVVIADKGYEPAAPAEAIEARGAEAVIPTLANRKGQRGGDPHLDRERNRCERFWSKAEQYRRVCTRYEKKAANYLAFVKVAAMTAMLR
jgi:transposase